MPPLSRALTHLGAVLGAVAAVCAQSVAPTTQLRFVPKQPVVRIAIHDLPALLEALPRTHFGKLFAEPDVAEAFATAQGNYAAKVEAWTDAVDALEKVDRTRVDLDAVAQRAFFGLDWRDFRSGEMVATRPADAEWYQMQSTFLLEPLPAAECRLAARFAALGERLREAAQLGDGVSEVEQKVDGHPAVVLARGEQNEHDHGRGAGDAWLLHLPGQFAAGNGSPALVGHCEPARRPQPGITVELDVRSYVTLMFGLMARGFAVPDESSPVPAALGLDACSLLGWRVSIAGELLQDDVYLVLDGKPGGVLGALLQGMAPPVAQPLPERGMLQVQCAFDVRALRKAVDDLLDASGQKTLQELDLDEDLHKAWTGGMALAVARPAVGALVPRLYASFGIVDREALDRLLDRLHAHPGLEVKEAEYEGEQCVVLRLPGMPPALQPCYCIAGDTIHFAESAASLRALLKARDAGAPPALDVGDARRPDGPGAPLPGVDVRFDGAEIHAAIHELWLPLMQMTGGEGVEPLLPLEDSPEPAVVLPHLKKGRGVLRRLPDRLVLSVTGTAGGPELHALLAAYGPSLSAWMTSSWTWETRMIREQLGFVKLEKVAEAFAAFRARTGADPASLGELIAGGDLADPTMLTIDGDEKAEPVMHEGKQVGTSSFRYFPKGVATSPQGDEITARLIAIDNTHWQRLVLDTEGTVHNGWGDFAEKAIDEFGK
jgi:hypothetical protein